MSTMSFTKDSFDDEELSIMAAEIMRDLQTNKNLDPTDSNPYVFTPHTDDSMDDEKLSKLPSLSYLSSVSELSVNTEGNMVYVNYPSMSPNIISDSKLSTTDSFNISIPPLPTVKHKPAINGWCQMNNKLPSCNNILPYIAPPAEYIDDNSHIIPRKHKKMGTVSQIPIFSDNGIQHEKDINIIYNTNNHKKQRKYKYKYKSKSALKRIISPIFIEFEKQNYRETKYNGKHKSKPTSKTPCVYKNKRINKKRNKKNRATSAGFEMNWYMVDLQNGYMFSTDIV